MLTLGRAEVNKGSLPQLTCAREAAATTTICQLPILIEHSEDKLCGDKRKKKMFKAKSHREVQHVCPI